MERTSLSHRVEQPGRLRFSQRQPSRLDHALDKRHSWALFKAFRVFLA